MRNLLMLIQMQLCRNGFIFYWGVVAPDPLFDAGFPEFVSLVRSHFVTLLVNMPSAYLTKSVKKGSVRNRNNSVRQGKGGAPAPSDLDHGMIAVATSDVRFLRRCREIPLLATLNPKRSTTESMRTIRSTRWHGLRYVGQGC